MEENIKDSLLDDNSESEAEETQEIKNEKINEEDQKDTEITPIDDVIQTITDKLDTEIQEETNNNETDDIEIELDSENESEEQQKEEDKNYEIPEIKENINIKKEADIPVYETDNSASGLIDNIPFKIGDKVYHPKHGNGVIEGFANYSNKILFCQIEFENVGRRILDPRISGIQKIS